MMAYGTNDGITRMDRATMAVTGQNPESGLSPRMLILVNVVFMAAGIAGLVLTTLGETAAG